MSQQRTPEIRSSENGLSLFVTSHEERSDLLRWSDVESVLAYKRDVFAHDLICLRFSTAEGTLEVDEEMQGWPHLVEILPEFLPGTPSFADWWERVAQPPFAPSIITLYKRG